MKHICLLATITLILGAGCFAFARQHSVATPDLTRQVRQAVTKSPPDPLTEAMFARRKRFRAPLLQQADTAMKEKRYADAESAFRKMVALDYTDGPSWARLADVCERQGKYAKALEAYHELLYSPSWSSSISSDVTMHMRYVLALCRSNQYAEAASEFNKAMDATGIAKMPDEMRQQAAQMRGNIPLGTSVREHSLLTVRIDPNNPDDNLLQSAAHYVLGTKHPSYGPPAPGEQLQHLRTAVRLAPAWGLAQSALSDALARQGDSKGAHAAQNRALALGDHNSRQEIIARLEDENSRKHMLRYHPNEPEHYQFHDPKMMPTQAERDTAMQALRARLANGSAPGTQ